MLWWHILLIVVGGIVLLGIALFLLTFAIYKSNADMKLVRFVYDKLQKHYDKMERDRKI